MALKLVFAKSTARPTLDHFDVIGIDYPRQLYKIVIVMIIVTIITLLINMRNMPADWTSVEIIISTINYCDYQRVFDKDNDNTQ